MFGDTVSYPRSFTIHAPFLEGIMRYCLSPGRSSDFRIFLLTAPSLQAFVVWKWHSAAFVPGHSGGPVPDFHRFPLRQRRNTLYFRTPIYQL